MNNITFLTEDQIFGNNRLEIFNRIGAQAAITDFSILLGGFVSRYHTDDGNSLENRTGWYWTKTDDGDNDARVVNNTGSRGCNDVNIRSLGARAALPYSSIKNISSNGVRGRSGILEIEYGEYPQKAVSRDMQRILENLFQQNRLTRTGKNYTTDSRKYDQYDKDFLAQTHTEYEYNRKKYVRVKANSHTNGNNFTLSNGEQNNNDNYVWIEVQPIKWLVDERNNIVISKSLLFAGVQFNKKRNYKGNFEQTDIKEFIDRYFSKEIVSNRQYSHVESNEEIKVSSRKKNPYGFSFDTVSEEEIIKGAVESGVAVFLHGRSSEGKSARVKQLDPDCEIIYLRNATPDSLNGKSVFNSNTGEMIDVPPTWYKKIKKKCEEELDKIHIVFFDEITNALPSIQGMAFNIVLDREVNGIWKLPENCRIVAAGNDLNDSLAANTMAEPLFNRFAHVYINTTVESWLKWAVTPKEEYERLDYEKKEPQAKIHPAIYAYISYKSYNGEDALRTKYNGETPNADPRKWEMASKVLYTTKNPEMLRALIGNDLTRDFTEFCRQQVISVEDVVNGNYTNRDFEMNLSQQYATAVGLSSVDEKNLEVVRNFIKKMNAEMCAMFDILWTHGDEKRLELIAELQLKEVSIGGVRR